MWMVSSSFLKYTLMFSCTVETVPTGSYTFWGSGLQYKHHNRLVLLVYEEESHQCHVVLAQSNQPEWFL